MEATAYELVGKARSSELGFADIHDFHLGESHPVPAEALARHPGISLYSLDFENRRAVFVETPPSADLLGAPFYYKAQYEAALRVVTLPFGDFVDAARAMPVEGQRLSIIYSVARAGSTLASQVFAAVDGVEAVSEPDALTLLTAARHHEPHNVAELKGLLEASVRWLCKSSDVSRWIIKGRGWIIELGDWLHELHPNAKNVFLYRDAESWVGSAIRAFGSAGQEPPEKRVAADRALRDQITPLAHLVARHPADEHLTPADLAALCWLSMMETCLRMLDLHARILPIEFSSWHAHPEETAIAMLNYCGCPSSDLSRVRAVLERDSQANTAISRENLKKRDHGPLPSDLAALKRHLERHRTIQSADFRIPGTLTFA